MATFVLKSYRNLKSRLGYFDAAIQFNELARQNQANAILSSKDPKTSLDDICNNLKIYTDMESILSSKLRLSQLYILSVFQLFDIFLHDFMNESCDIHGLDSSWRHKTSQEDYLEFCLSKVTVLNKSTRNNIGEFRIQCIQYYREVRNCFLHNSEKDILKLNEKLKKLIDDHQSDISIHYKKLPKNFDSLDIMDFFLYTTLVKNIAFEMCCSSMPSADVLAQFVLKSFPKLKGKKKDKRMQDKLENLLLSNFGIDDKRYVGQVIKSIW